jgi:lysozyme
MSSNPKGGIKRRTQRVERVKHVQCGPSYTSNGTRAVKLFHGGYLFEENFSMNQKSVYSVCGALLVYVAITSTVLAKGGCAANNHLSSMRQAFYQYLASNADAQRRNAMMEPHAFPPPVKANGSWTTVPFIFPTDAVVDRYTDGNPPRKSELFGIDISGYDSKLPYGSLKSASVTFVLIKASEGINCKDPNFDIHWNGMKTLGQDKAIPFSAYHFLSSTAGETGAMQADQFLTYVGAEGGLDAGGMRPGVDLEWDFQGGRVDHWTNRTPNDIISTVHDFVTRVKKRTGWTPMIYTNLEFLKDHGIVAADDLETLRAGAKIWNFDLAAKDLRLEQPIQDKVLEPILWQFNWQMKLNSGYFGGDVDVFFGSQGDLRSELLLKN